MKFTTNANMNFSSLKGEFPITYAELVEIFGPPKYGPNADLDKTTCEWALEFEDGTKASIYDYKTPCTPMWLLHARRADDRTCTAQRRAGCQRRTHPRSALGQSLPLYWVSTDCRSHTRRTQRLSPASREKQ